MEFQKNENVYIIRLEENEEIIDTIKNFCMKNEIKAGFLTGIGAIKSATLGFFDPENKRYHEQKFDEYAEITSLTGNISQSKGMPYLHLHITCSNSDFTIRGGHLSAATISATGEIYLVETKADIKRKFSEEIGLNLLEF